MQIRLDKDNAAAVRKEAEAHRRIFKRRRSYADVVNLMVRDWVFMVRKKDTRDKA